MKPPVETYRIACLAAALLAASAGVCAAADGPWEEGPVPPAPTYATSQLLPLEMPPYVSFRFGIDPQSLSIGSDGVVRYVAVATSPSGATTAFYEGLRCATGEVRTYARSSSPGHWTPSSNSRWLDFTSAQLPSKHAWAFSRQGGCDNRMAPPNSVADIVRAFKR